MNQSEFEITDRNLRFLWRIIDVHTEASEVCHCPICKNRRALEPFLIFNGQGTPLFDLAKMNAAVKIADDCQFARNAFFAERMFALAALNIAAIDLHFWALPSHVLPNCVAWFARFSHTMKRQPTFGEYLWSKAETLQELFGTRRAHELLHAAIDVKGLDRWRAWFDWSGDELKTERKLREREKDGRDLFDANEFAAIIDRAVRGKGSVH